MTPKIKHEAEILSRALSYACDKVVGIDWLLDKYGSLADVASVPRERLAEAIGDKAAELIKLTAALEARRVCERILAKRTLTDSEIDECFLAMSLGKSVEVVYAMSFDKNGRVIAVDEVSEGTVNSSEILPRKLLEVAYKRHAVSVILAHNHPRGEARASDADIESTATVARILHASKIRLVRHVIVGGGEAVKGPVCRQMQPLFLPAQPGALAVNLQIFAQCGGIETAESVPFIKEGPVQVPVGAEFAKVLFIEGHGVLVGDQVYGDILLASRQV